MEWVILVIFVVAIIGGLLGDEKPRKSALRTSSSTSSRGTERLADDCSTYLIRGASSGLVKIGSTCGSPESRRAALQTGSPEPLELVGVLSGRHHERDLHQRFADLRVRGEWFDARVLDRID